MMRPSVELDVFACGLDGINQIEASAGTGKTWNICALYLRLLLEAKLNVDQILVVTFTKAATAELHERIRERLAGALAVLDSPAARDQAAASDPFIAGLFAHVIGDEAHHRIAPQEAQQRLQHALRGFDQAAIHTIHAFCQRALQEAPFAAGLPFEVELAADDRALRLEAAAQFWRETVEPLSRRVPGLPEWLVDKRAEPASLDMLLARHLQKPLAEVRWGEAVPATLADIPARGAALGRALHEAYTAAATLWAEQRDRIVGLLDAALPALKATSHKPELVRAACEAWADYFASGGTAPVPSKHGSRIGLAALEKARKKEGRLPEHPFFAALDTLLAAASAQAEWHERVWLGLVRAWLAWAPDALRSLKRTRRTISFADLLGDLQRALSTHPWLAQTLRARYAAALIDEFQDTDPLQFDIFMRVFAPAAIDGDDGDEGDDGNHGEDVAHHVHGGAAPVRKAAPLFLVGDPKQAIYSFRAADLHTYLAARERAAACYTLAVNQRSTAALIDACNRIFGSNARAFILPGLNYDPVRAGTRVREPLVDPDRPAGSADFQVWRLPGGDAAWPKAQAQQRAAEACAAEIVRLLDGAAQGRVCIGREALKPGEIAVLVQTNRQGALIKRVLSAWGVGSVELGQASVFASIDAVCLERMLQAIETPGDPRRLRAALASDWLGLDAQALVRLDGPAEKNAAGGVAAALDAAGWVERLMRYRTLWHERGFAPMWRTLLQELEIPQRLAALPDGERRLTNLAHLAELTQTEGAGAHDMAAVLRWLSAQRSAPDAGEHAQLRLESDRNLVQIVTVHKSKGLEYAVAFCPFLNDGLPRPRSGDSLPSASEYRDEAGGGKRVVLHYDSDAERAEQAAAQALEEQAAERARLIYVALTRAIYRCYIVSGEYRSGQGGHTTDSRKSLLDWLVAGEGHTLSSWFAQPLESTELDHRWQALAGGAIGLAPLPSIRTREPLRRVLDDRLVYTARRAVRNLRDSWRIASFSALALSAAGGRATGAAADMTAGAGLQQEGAEARPDHDAWTQGGTVRDDDGAGRYEIIGDAMEGTMDGAMDGTGSDTRVGIDAVASQAAETSDEHAAFYAGFNVEPVQPQNNALPQTLRADDDILDFPRGAAAGECLHRMFELADFSDRATWPDAIARALREFPVDAPPALAARLPAMMARVLADVLDTQLLPTEAAGLRLSRVTPAVRLSELAFSMPAHALDLAELGALLQAHGYTALPALRYAGGMLDGYLKGFIDLVFEAEGRFWIVDWKSNHLGDGREDYAAPALVAAMDHHLYVLQALIYSVALHRYLRLRLPDYDYERDFGGALYLFLRGVRPAWRDGMHSAGVHLERPSAALITALDGLLAGRPGEGRV